MRNRILQRLTDAADLPGEPLPGGSLLELLGDRRVLIEGHRGITHYSPEKIVVTVSYGHLEICGQAMELAKMTAGELLITGSIHTLSLERREKS